MLFTPSTKVQKDRAIMRQTDARMAKYSRAATFMHVGGYLLSLVTGEYYQAIGQTALWLAVLLLGTSAWRAYYSIRFDVVYARGPNRWRNFFFLASLLHIAVWSFVVSSHVILLGVKGITPLILILTAGFTASITSVYAPYLLYLRTMLVVALVPPSIALALTQGGIVYCLLMLAFYFLLNHQGRVIGDHYWQGLETNMELRRRAEGLEIEKRTKDARVEYKNELLAKISQELRTPLNDVLGSMSLLRDTPLNDRQKELLMVADTASTRVIELLNNVLDYSRIVSKELVITPHVFNLRSKLDLIFEDLAQSAQQQGIELYTIYPPDFSERVKGDAKRINQIISLIGSHALELLHSKELCAKFNVDLLPNSASHALVIEMTGKGNRLIREENAAESKQRFHERLGINIAEGILKCMGGELRYFDSAEAQSWSIIIPLEPAPIAAGQFHFHPDIHGQSMALIGFPQKLLPSIESLCESWHIEVNSFDTLTEFKEQLADNVGGFTLASIYLPLEKDIPESEINSLFKLDSALRVQFIASVLQRGQFDRNAYAFPEKRCDFVVKPLTRKKLHDSLCRLLISDKKSMELTDKRLQGEGENYRVLLVDDHKVNQMVTKGMLNKIGYGAKVANNGIEALGMLDQNAFDLILMDCQMPEMDGFDATRAIREREQGGQHIPIVAMTANVSESDKAKCFAAGMDDFLAKPVRPDDLERTIIHWLGLGQPGA